MDKIDKTLSRENLDLEIKAKDAAYVIYTSGSTGKPKGVVIPHYAVIDHHYAMKAAIGIKSDDRFFAVASVSFDPSVQDFFLPLFIGASVFVADQEAISDGYLLKERIRASHATLMQATPATWRMLLTAGWKGSKDLTILCGGEGLTRELANSLITRSKSLFNIYGPTETTIWSTVKKLLPERLEKEASLGYLPIGKPIRNVQIFILDDLKQQVPLGVAGELYVGGVGIAPQGYFKREKLTQEKFVPNPFSNNGDK